MKKNYITPTAYLVSFKAACQFAESIPGYSGQLGSRRRHSKRWDDDEDFENDEDNNVAGNDGTSAGADEW